MKDPVRLALLGAGDIGTRHLELAGEEPGCEIVAAADPNEAAAEVAGRHGARFYRDYRELLDCERLDGAIIATPNDAHAQAGIACTERRLPVLVEKPITDTLESGRALVDAAAAHGVRLQSVIIAASTLRSKPHARRWKTAGSGSSPQWSVLGPCASTTPISTWAGAAAVRAEDRC